MPLEVFWNLSLHNKLFTVLSFMHYKLTKLINQFHSPRLLSKKEMENTSVANSTDRVRKNAPESSNAKIDAEILEKISTYRDKNGHEISKRIVALEKEWSIERKIETFAPSLILGGLALTYFHDKKWAALPAVVAAFLLQHGIQGWCPPVPLFRALGARTRKEIDWEKFALKFLRGDFDQVPLTDEAAVFEAVRQIAE